MYACMYRASEARPVWAVKPTPTIGGQEEDPPAGRVSFIV